MRKYIRTCQECGKRQERIPPSPKDKAQRWRHAKCIRCHSEGLDYGSWQEVDNQLNRIIEEPDYGD